MIRLLRFLQFEKPVELESSEATNLRGSRLFEWGDLKFSASETPTMNRQPPSVVPSPLRFAQVQMPRRNLPPARFLTFYRPRSRPSPLTALPGFRQPSATHARPSPQGSGFCFVFDFTSTSSAVNRWLRRGLRARHRRCAQLELELAMPRGPWAAFACLCLCLCLPLPAWR